MNPQNITVDYKNKSATVRQYTLSDKSFNKSDSEAFVIYIP